MRVRVAKADLEQQPWLTWNAFIHLIASRSEALTAEQLCVHSFFVYYSEVQNGGHLQYFENQGFEGVDEALAALKLMGSPCMYNCLGQAAELWADSSREPLDTAEKFVEAAIDNEFGSLDKRFYACSPDGEELLRRYLEAHLDELIEFV